MRLIFLASCCFMLIAAGCGRPVHYEHERHMIEYDVRPEASEYVIGEEVRIRVRVVNRGDTAIQIPDPGVRTSTQPVHSLVGPRWPDGIRFTNMRLIRNVKQLPTNANAALITIEPGKEWSGVFSPNRVIGPADGGDYRLASELVYDAVRAESQQTTFRIRPLRPGSMHLGLGTRPLENGEGEGAFIDADTLYTFTFTEGRPAIGEAQLNGPSRRTAVDPAAADAAVPLRNAGIFSELVRWVLWREGRQIKALSSTMREPVSVELPGEVSRLVQPPLKVNGQPVQVLSVSADGRTLHLATVGVQPGQGARGAVAWSVPLPDTPGQMTATLGPVAGGSERHLAFIATRDAGFDVFHSRFKDSGKPEPFRSVRVATGSVIPTSTVGLFANASGTATVGIVSCSGTDRRSCALAEATFGSDGKDASNVIPLGTLPATPVDAAVLYAEKNGAIDRRVVVVKLDDGRLMKSTGSTFAPVASAGMPTSPMLLAPGKQATYILYVDGGRLHLEAL